MHASLEEVPAVPEKPVVMKERLAAPGRRQLGSLVQQVSRLCAQVHGQQMHQTLVQLARASRA